jgi:hypothetical protein
MYINKYLNLDRKKCCTSLQLGAMTTGYNVREKYIHTQVMLLLFILTANGVLPDSSGTTIRHNTEITHTTLKQNTAHKTTK